MSLTSVRLCSSRRVRRAGRSRSGLPGVAVRSEVVLRSALGEIKDEMRRRRHDSLTDHGRWLRSVVAGYFAYRVVPGNAQAIGAYRHHVLDMRRRSLKLRSQKDCMTCARMTGSPPGGCHLMCFTRGPKIGWLSETRGWSRSSFSGRTDLSGGVPGNRHLYRDRQQPTAVVALPAQAGFDPCLPAPSDV